MALKFRRGTTAQKSGSLAFGEPYVNTTLGTLQIGLESGDVTLSSTGTGSNLVVGGISGSSLDITGNANIAGNLTLGGQLTIGDQTSDTVNVVASLSSSLIPSVDNAFDLGSQTKIWRDLYISTGSIRVVADGAILSSITTNADGSQTFPNGLYSQANITIGSGSYVNIGKFEIGRRGDTPDNNTVLGIDVMPDLTTGEFNTGIGRGTLYNLTTGTNNISVGDQAGYTMTNGSGNITIGASAAFTLADPGGMNGQPVSNTFIGNTAGTYVNSGFYTTAIGGNALLGQNGVTDRFIKNTAIGYGSGNNVTGTSSNNIYIGVYAGPATSTSENYKLYISNGESGDQPFMYGDMSNDNRTLDINASVNISGSVTGQIKATNGVVSGSSQITDLNNSFSGLQTFNNINVNGTASFAYIQSTTGSSTSIGEAFIVLNENTPSSNFAGIKVVDSGSTFATASFVYDGLNNNWVFEKALTGSSDTSVAIFGPISTGGLGTEVGLTQNKLPKAVSSHGHHIGDSNITDDGTTITLGSNTVVNGTLVATGTTLVSGSSQIDATATTNWSTGIKTQLNSNTVVSGSSQITLSSTTGGSTTSDVRFGSLGIGMAASGTSGRIDASGDIVAFSTSDRNFKENITPIPNALEKISKISGNTYDWKEDMKDFHGFEGNDVGVIAQEIEEVLPQLVTTRETGYKAVKYDKLVALLIEGIKEQQTQIHNLTLEVENLKKQKGL
jgi:hypothetical protein